MNKLAVWLGTAVLVIVGAILRVWTAEEMNGYPAGTQTAVGAVAYYIVYYGIFAAIAVAAGVWLSQSSGVVPVFLLQWFVDPADGARLWVYDKDTGAVWQSSPRPVRRNQDESIPRS